MKIGVIGCGGIGSYLAMYMNKLVECKQFPEDTRIRFFDDDVVETKNIIYQNFESGDVDDKKTEALAFKYPMIDEFVDKRINEVIDMCNYDLFVLCADNNKIRKLAWDAYYTLGVKFIDARSNGRTCGIYSSETNNYTSTLSGDDSSGSCQYPYQLAKKEIELGNVIIASVTAQAILNFVRTGNLPNDFVHSF